MIEPTLEEINCSAIQDIGEHVRGSILIDRISGDFLGYACLFCGVRMTSQGAALEGK